MKIQATVLMIFVLFMCTRCADDEATLPEVTTTSVTNITDLSALSGGEIVSNGGSAITARGVCWSSTGLPTIDDSRTEDGTGNGSFTSSLSGLTGGTTYLVRAYAVNNVGISYGEQVEFTTNPTPALATITTAIVTNISTQTATSGGNITNDGNSPVTARGICWSMSNNPTVADTKTTDGSGSGEFVSNLTSLSAGTTYYVRAYATNAVGTSYGNEIEFSTNSITATFYTTKDASIFNNLAGNSPNGNYGAGASELLQVGYASPTGIYARTLLQFDLSTIPANAVIENVVLQFTQGSSGSATSYIISVHKLSQQWSEGVTSFCTYNNPCNTQGVAITPGGTDVTWNETTYSGSNMNPWTTLGGTFFSTASASAAAGSTTIGTPYSFTSSELKDDVQVWVTNSSTNFGWVLKTDFITTSSAMKRFYSREGAVASGDATTSPRLIITYR